MVQFQLILIIISHGKMNEWGSSPGDVLSVLLPAQFGTPDVLSVLLPAQSGAQKGGTPVWVLEWGGPRDAFRGGEHHFGGF